MYLYRATTYAHIIFLVYYYVNSTIAVLPSKAPETVHLTIFTMGEIFIIFLYFRIFAIFYNYMKNKIGILENDIYIFPIVNSVNL